MKQKLLYAFVPVMAFAVLGIGSASANGMFRHFVMWHNTDPQEVAAQHQEMFSHQAELLGIDVELVKDAWAEGKDLKTLAEENGISADELRTKMEAKRKEMLTGQLQTLVEQNVITQDQADKRATTLASPSENHEQFSSGIKMKIHRGLEF